MDADPKTECPECTRLKAELALAIARIESLKHEAANRAMACWRERQHLGRCPPSSGD